MKKYAVGFGIFVALAAWTSQVKIWRLFTATKIEKIMVHGRSLEGNAWKAIPRS